MRKKLPPRTAYYYRQFVSGDAKNIAHPLDAKRFYRFIQAAHHGRTRLIGQQLKELLINDGFQRKVVEELGELYDHGRGLLKTRVALNYHLEWKEK